MTKSCSFRGSCRICSKRNASAGVGPGRLRASLGSLPSSSATETSSDSADRSKSVDSYCPVCPWISVPGTGRSIESRGKIPRHLMRPRFFLSSPCSASCFCPQPVWHRGPHCRQFPFLLTVKSIEKIMSKCHGFLKQKLYETFFYNCVFRSWVPPVQVAGARVGTYPRPC